MEDTRNPVSVEVEVVKADGSSVNYKIKVPRGVSLLDTLTLLQKQTDFTFETEPSSLGLYLIEVNGERAEQSIRDYKIEVSQTITFTNTTYSS